MCRRIANRDGVPISAVMGSADYIITKEIEMKETEENNERNHHG